MGVKLGVEKRSLASPASFAAAFLVLLCIAQTCNGTTIFYYQMNQYEAFQSILEAWKETPRIESNLAGWNKTDSFPCLETPNWRGVQCLNFVNCTFTDALNNTACYTYIIGLTLENASIVGHLPEQLGDIFTLFTLELTGNPQLTGSLPAKLNTTNLSILDVHDNAFEGELPYFETDILFTIDLSGNKFKGTFPLPQIRLLVSLQILKLARNRFEGALPEEAFKNMTQLSELDLSSNMFHGTLPNLTTTQSLRYVNLSRNNFIGSVLISSYFNRTKNNNLVVLDLSYNQLTIDPNIWSIYELGDLQELYLDNVLIDETLNITRLYDLGLLETKSIRSTEYTKKLKILSLMNNSISNLIYNAKVIEDVTTIIRLQGNPFCKSSHYDDGRRCFCNQTCINSVPIEKSKRKAVIIGSVVSSTSVLILVISLAVIYYRNKKYEKYLMIQVQQMFEEFEVKPTIFPFSQLRTATRDFHPDLKLGEGAFGAVYMGTMPNGNVMAVKQLFPSKNSKGLDEFLNEVVLLTGMKHRNLVNLKGCCIREQQRLLVYEYVDNHDVDQVLLRGANKALLSWPVRWKICLGVARGLHYLHALAHPRIIHRDIKASNVLLTKNYDSKIADFGLALLYPDEQSYIVTKHVAGTNGYLAPEYASFGELSDKVDVFSFGVLCLEIVSGRRNIDGESPPNKIYLFKWAWNLHRQGKLMDLVDPTMTLRDEEKEEVHRVINIGLLCIQNEAEQRPSMERVVAMLQGESAAEVPVLKPESEKKLLKTISLYAECKSEVGIVKEEGESSFMNSSKGPVPRLKDDYSTGALVELSEVKVR